MPFPNKITLHKFLMIIYINFNAVSKQNNFTYIFDDNLHKLLCSFSVILVYFILELKQNNFTYISDDNLHKLLCSFQTK